jgi:hypothetical protein
MRKASRFRSGKGRSGLRETRASASIALIAALAFVVQLLAFPYHQARAGYGFAPNAASVAAELKATFGDAAALCTESGRRGAPSPAGTCDDQCPLCRFASQSAALVAPDTPALPKRLDAACNALGGASEPGVVSFRLENRNRARAPPLTV